jgi:Co/Zn/Cd efflux system component
VLLDMQAPDELREGIRKAVESEGDNRISDMHVWSVGPGLYAAEIAVVSSRPLETPGYYDLLPKNLGIVHIMVETHQCASPGWKAP